ncbi:MAG TPA: alpha/beta hydrolase-fold protein [Gemmatimonadaceae bacterium]|nr:alpha/beta hydrolase-fold protein [Gemmatimonadaceae bacterium]
MRLPILGLVTLSLAVRRPADALGQGTDAAPALVAIASSAPRADATRHFSIASKVLGETRRIGIAFPASYTRSAAEHRYPVAIVLDGESLLAPAASVSATLADNGQIPELVVVAIENTNRLRDLTPPGLSVSGSSTREGGDKFLDFIERELLPAVDRQFRTAAPRVLLGHSSGGILATYAAATRRGFRAVVALDTPVDLGDGWLVQRLLARAKSDTAALRYAAIDARFSWPSDSWASLAGAAPRTWALHHEHLANENHTSMPFLGMYLGLRELFADYSVIAAPKAPTTSILPHYTKVAVSLGGPVAPPRTLLTDVIDDLLAEGRGQAARDAYQTLISAYGEPRNAASLKQEIAEAVRRPPPKETVESLLAIPFPTPEAMRAYVGEWVGDTWMNADEPRTGRQRLRIRVVDGRVEGETIHRPTSAAVLVQKWTYLQLTPNGFTYGYVNGMRPRGMLLFEGTIRGDTLSGDMRFAGISARGPDGDAPPPIHFSFRRVATGS